MSDVMAKERFVVVGVNSKESLEEVKTLAKNHNSDRVQLVYPGFKETTVLGDKVLYPSYISAAMHAGRAAFLEDGESATFDYYNVDELEVELEPSQITDLLSHGVAPLEFVLGQGVRLSQDITTFTTDDQSLYVERSVRIMADAFNKELRERIERLAVGSKGSRTTLTSVKNLVISFLKQKIREDQIHDYRNVRVSFENRVLMVEYEAAPVEPANFVLIQGQFYSEDRIFA